MAKDSGRAMPAGRPQAPVQRATEPENVLEKLLEARCPTTGISLRELLGVSPSLQDLLRKALTRKSDIIDSFGSLFHKTLLREAYQKRELA